MLENWNEIQEAVGQVTLACAALFVAFRSTALALYGLARVCEKMAEILTPTWGKDDRFFATIAKGLDSLVRWLSSIERFIPRPALGKNTNMPPSTPVAICLIALSMSLLSGCAGAGRNTYARVLHGGAESLRDVDSFVADKITEQNQHCSNEPNFASWRECMHTSYNARDGLNATRDILRAMESGITVNLRCVVDTLERLQNALLDLHVPIPEKLQTLIAFFDNVTGVCDTPNAEFQ